jgi:hypothetical protein
VSLLADHLAAVAGVLIVSLTWHFEVAKVGNLVRQQIEMIVVADWMVGQMVVGDFVVFQFQLMPMAEIGSHGYLLEVILVDLSIFHASSPNPFIYFLPTPPLPIGIHVELPLADAFWQWVAAAPLPVIFLLDSLQHLAMTSVLALAVL